MWYEPARGDSRLGYETGGEECALVPPPECMQASIQRAARDLLRRRSAWSLFVGLFGRLADRSATAESSFVAKVGRHEVAVSAAFDLPRSSVVLRLSPEAPAAMGAGVALKFLVYIRPSMTLEQVEGMLGPGTEGPAPILRCGPGDLPPVVRGERVFFWEEDGMEIYLGFENDKVRDKWFWAPSL